MNKSIKISDMNKKENTNSSLRVEILKASHFSMLSSINPSEKLNWLQLMLINCWVAQAERKFPGWLPAKRPFCLLALETNKPIALIVLRPCNLRGTCWSVSFPELLSDPKEYSIKTIRLNLLRHSLDHENNRARSWIIRCPANDQNQLETSRELGFQPLKILNQWLPPKNSINSKILTSKINNNNYEWQDINNTNAQYLWRLEQAGESSHLRQILDRQSKDLIQPKQPFNGVLIYKDSKPHKAIAGLVARDFYENQLIIELVRDIAWDERITKMLPKVLRQLNNHNKEIILETNHDDEILTNLLNESGWSLKSEVILLGRSLWRRQENKKLIKGARQLDSMLGRLNPQNPPLPTPSLGRR